VYGEGFDAINDRWQVVRVDGMMRNIQTENILGTDVCL
jgi:hypothetical protein